LSCTTAPGWFFAGLDLGQAHQFTALAVLEKTYAPDPRNDRYDLSHYDVRHLERFPPGTQYAVMFDRLSEMFGDDQLAGSILAVDQTGVGEPVMKLLRGSGVDAEFEPITITAGHQATYDAGIWMVPKKELVGVLQVLLQGRRLRVAPTMGEAQTLVRELTNFRAKVTVATAEVELDWREGAHDDLVLAVAVAAWEGERHRPLTEADMPFTLGGRAPRPWW
jgi:hypothetical protein